jgi:hypothetical protein
MRFFATLLLLAAVAIPSGSHAQNPQAPPQPAAAAPSTHATIYFYRYKQYVGSALSPSVFCDEAQLARMENGRYFMAHIEPGKHTFRSNDAQSGVELDLKPGEKYYIRIEIAPGMMKGHGRLVMAPVEQGIYDLKSNKLKPLGADMISDKARVSVEEEPAGSAQVQSSAGK